MNPRPSTTENTPTELLRAIDAYRVTAVEDASPLALVCMLYEGALRHLDRAAAADPARPGSPFVASILRADAIVAELRLSLASEHAPELVTSLQQLYLFVEARLRLALRERRREPLAEARAVLERLQDGWKAIGTAGISPERER